ncbi:ras-related protein Rab-27B-like [Oscarella lobularis]|uniref:ras-related protein Rab-27B-like n=1 Tax=Oscarella lobularis TaxID=121494 RepID=UPI00331319E1
MNETRRSTAGDYDYLIKLLVLGDSGVGKTSFLVRFVDDQFSNRYLSTVGIDFKEKRVTKNRKKLRLQLWDTAGQERFRSLATAFFRNAMGFVVMFDVTNEQSFLNTRSWLQQLRTHAYTEDPVTILVGNKTDLDHIRKVQKSDAERFADKLGLKYMETSAQSGANVREAFEILLDGVLERMQRNVPAVGDPRVPDLVPDIEREDVRELKAENEAEEKRGLKRILPCCN